jgi:hypothetical protein
MVCDLPRTEIFTFFEAEEGEKMEFRLVYQGPLPPEKCEPKDAVLGAGKSRAKDKHRLRKHFHLQMRELWHQHPDLRRQADLPCYRSPRGFVFLPQEFPPGATNVKKYVDFIADDHQRCGGRFVPLVSEQGGFTCALDILFLRRDAPGNLIENGGDIDNRIKVLLDGLRIPKNISELGGFAIDADEDPFYCLLEDDRLVTRISVTTDRLIVPKQADENINDVLLVIQVTVVNPSSIFAGGRLV